MSDYLEQLQHDLLQWARRAAGQHWLEPATLAALEQHSLASPASLFTGSERPLVVGLFGGTGVGKSSLLNRLAREPIARASAERPTSRDISVYVHNSVTVSRLPDEFPLERMRTTLHQRDDYRHVMWIDMPDFDSVESSHRDQVDQWLPHLDVIVYVVSPERYRDDDGWRLLRANARGHAWLFVMNQWDRGDPVQLDDFRGLLERAGFRDPLLFATDSRAADTRTDAESQTTAGHEPDHATRTSEAFGSQTPDSHDSSPSYGALADLEHTITYIADGQLIAQLGELGVLERARALREQADNALAGMGDPASLQRYIDRWPAHWNGVAESVEQAAHWPIEALARRHAQQQTPDQASPVTGLLSVVTPAFMTREEPVTQPPGPPLVPLPGLLDDALSERIDTGIEQFVLEAPEASVPARPLAQQLGETHESRLLAARLQVDQALAQSLVQPGTHWQRTVHHAAGLCAALLPLLALCWIGLRIVAGFWRGAADTTAYLGTDFAVHSVLLLGVAWALPAIAQQRLKPSREAAAARGLRRGLASALDELGRQVRTSLKTALDNRQRLDKEYAGLWQASQEQAHPELPDQARRLLVDPAD